MLTEEKLFLSFLLIACLSQVNAGRVAEPPIRLDVLTPSGTNQLTVSCTLDASLTTTQKITSLTLQSSKLGADQNSLDTLATVDLWSSHPHLASDISVSDVEVFGRIGLGENTNSQLVLSWKSSNNGYSRFYKCLASGLDENGYPVSISLTSSTVQVDTTGHVQNNFDLFHDLAEKLDSSANMTDDLRASILGIQDAVGNIQQTMTKSISATRSKFENVSHAVSGLKATMNRRLATTNRELVTFSGAVDNVERKMDKCLAGTTSMNTVVKKLEMTVAKLQRTVDAQSKSLLSLTQTMTLAQLSQSKYLDQFIKSEVFQGRWYYVSKTATPFNIDNAEATCASFGAHLLELEDAQEFNFVHMFLTRHGISHSFTGATDMDREGTWIYRHSGRPLTFVRWVPGQPDNWMGLEDCQFFAVTHNGLSDVPCTSKATYVCEGPVLSL